MHSTNLGVHLKGEVPGVSVKKFTERPSFFTVDIIFEKSSVQFFFDTEQQLTNFKNNFLWATEKPIKM